MHHIKARWKEFKWLEFSSGKYHTERMMTWDELVREREKSEHVGQELFISRYAFDRDNPYYGPVLSNLYFDFDSKDNLNRAKAEALDCIEIFKGYGVPIEAIKKRFTGGKGFSVEIPFQFFDLEPSEHLPTIWKKIALQLKSIKGWRTMDSSVYDRRRLWRLTNTRHQSGLYKIPVTYDEMKSSIKKILDKALRKVNYAGPTGYISDMERNYDPLPDCVSLYHKAKEEVEKEARERLVNIENYVGKEIPEMFEEAKVWPCVRERIMRGVNIDEGKFRREPTAFNIAVALHRLGAPKEYIKQQLLVFAKNCKPEFPESRYGELDHAIEMAFLHEYSTHCHTPCFAMLCDKEKCWIHTGLPVGMKQELTPEIEDFLKNPNLHQEIEKIISSVIVGESNLKMLCFYLGIGTAVHTTPSGIILVDQLGVGKSWVERWIATLFPQESVDQPTSISQKVVNYLAGNFKGRIVRIDELYGFEEGLPYIRVWMTEGRLEHWVPDVEKRKEMRIKVEGCPVFFTSTTQEPEEQLGSRNWIAHIDTSRWQTKRIHIWQDIHDSLPTMFFEPDKEKQEFLTKFTRWLLQNAKPVLIPYRISFPTEDPRSRRDRPRFKQLVKSVANLYQIQRKKIVVDDVEYIISELEDFKITSKISSEFLRSTVTTLDKYCIQILDFMNENPELATTIKELTIVIPDPSESTIRRKVEHLQNRGYLEKNEGSKRTSTGGVRVNLYALTERGKNFQKQVQIKIMDDGSWLLPLYGKLDDPDIRSAIVSHFSQVLEEEHQNELELQVLEEREKSAKLKLLKEETIELEEYNDKLS
jgi:DNA-binding PadR family transcriptional regulator